MILLPKNVIFRVSKGRRKIFKKTAFSLIEVILIIIILAILYSITVPGHQKMVEKNRAETAKLNLVSIYNAEKRYKLDNGRYFICAAPCGLTTLNDTLDLYIKDDNFTYSVVSDTQSGFKAIATRSSGNLCNGKTMSVIGTNSTAVKDCSVW